MAAPFVKTARLDYLSGAKVESLLTMDKSGWDYEVVDDIF